MGNCYSYVTNMKLNNELKKLDDTVELFDLKGMEYSAKVVDVYDGDTCTVIFNLSGNLVKFKCRCKGYDSPEMKPPKDATRRLKIKEKAIDARNYLISRITDLDNPLALTKEQIKIKMKQNKKIIKLKCYDYDKYGRILGEFIVNGKNINQEMINKKYGYPYDGGTKR